jgi:Icc-related predicted phosphoesterase
MKICAISDMHGILDFDIKPCDILCICGDILPLNIQSLHQSSIDWLIDAFIPWCEKQPCDKVFFIAGNHDWLFMKHPDEIDEIFKDNNKITYLLDKDAEYTKETSESYENIRIYGTPWCHQFYNWAFMTSDKELEKIYNKIPYKVDILLTHDCPYGTSDIILQDVPWKTGDHIGCHPLGDAVDEKKPKIHFCGHLHSCTHEPQQRGETIVTNVSVVNESYKRVYEPLYMDI